VIDMTDPPPHHSLASSQGTPSPASDAASTRRERQRVEILSAILQGQTAHALGLAFEHLDEFSIDPVVVRMLSSAVADRGDPGLSVELALLLCRVSEKP
jgi:hypothetical protein